MRPLNYFWTAILMSVSALGFSGCNGSIDSNKTSGTDIRVQTLTFTWQGHSVTHKIFCAPTKFPALRRGSGGDPLGGGVSASFEIRGKVSGKSPVRQWSMIDDEEE